LVRAGFVGCLAWVAWSDRAHPSGAGTPQDALGFALREVAEQRGIRFRHKPCKIDPKVDNAAPHITALGASVSVADFDGDGWSDLYATSSAFGTPNALLRNRGDGNFEDVASAAGVADLNRAGEGASMGSLWGDVDGDGREDLLVYRWGYQALLRNETPSAGGAARFCDVSESSGVRRWMNCNSAVFLDYDRDGDLDLYQAGYFHERFDMWNLPSTEIMQDSFEFATNAGRNFLLRNDGAGRFEDVTAQAGCDSTRWTLAVAAADMDGDGWVDLYLANDYGPEELFQNRGDGSFARMAGVGLDESSKSGMSATLGDFENSGRFGVFVTNISKAGFLFQGNNLRLNRLHAGGRLINVADVTSSRSRAVVDCGWGWGAQFGDLDNDGWLDLFVANGFLSASKERDYWYDMSKIAGGAGRVFEDARNWPPIGDKSLSGYERSSVLRGLGEARFADVAERCGVTDDLDGRGVALADLSNRGVLDVIVANQNGPLLVYANEVDPLAAWIQFRLRARGVNTSAIGAEVTIEAGSFRQVQAVHGGVGFAAQNDRRLHFGLGRVERVDRARIRWPAGREQVLEAPALRTLHVIEEPAP
jgi:hypothetical protein